MPHQRFQCFDSDICYAPHTCYVKFYVPLNYFGISHSPLDTANSNLTNFLL